jgi:hypothetical protein
MASSASDRRRELFASWAMAALLIGGIGAAIAWMPLDDSGTVLWSLRGGFTVLAVGGLIAYFFTFNPKDEVTDHLRQLSKGKHFDLDGFAFLPTVVARNGVAYVEVLFQNQRDCAAIGRVLMVPLGRLFRDSGLKAVAFEVPCEPGVFGVARLPIPVPVAHQGEWEHWNVGAGIEFPNGKGGLLRFGHGLQVGRVDALSDGAQAMQLAATVASILVLSPSISVPAQTRHFMPEDVLAELPDGLEPEIEVLKTGN